jgi:hypothetical protein
MDRLVALLFEGVDYCHRVDMNAFEKEGRSENEVFY